MKGNEIIKDIIREEMPDTEQVRANCLNLQTAAVSANNSGQKKRFALKLKPAVVTAIIAAMLVTAAAASAPFIFKMLGSDIGFFNTDKQTRYSPYQETLKKYSTKVNITQEQDGISFTIDNIAVDDNFINIFYTIKSDYNLYDAIQNWCIDFYKIKTASMWYMNPDMRDMTFDLFIPVLDYKISGIDTELNEKFGNFSNFDSRDFYVVSDNEIKVAQKMLISEELPDEFTIDIFISSLTNGYISENLQFVNIPLTIDRTATSIQTVNVYPNINAVFTGAGRGDKIISHDITVEKVSRSPLGNVIVF